MNPSLGRPVADLEDFLAPPDDKPLRAAPGPAPPAPARRDSAGRWILGTAALLIVAAVGYLMLNDDSHLAPATATARDATFTSTGVGGFAELYLAAYLGGDAAALAALAPGSDATPAGEPGTLYVTRAAALEIDEVSAGYWSVTVGADVLAAADGGYIPAGLQLFRVAVLDDGGRLVPAALPARSAAPAPRREPPRILQKPSGEPTEAEIALVGDFLEALLTDGRELPPYVSVGSPIEEISPSPYAAITVTATAAYPGGIILATVDATPPSGGAVTLQYAIQIATESSRPMVAGILPGPPLVWNAGSHG